MPTTVLLTGFEPFDGRADNPSIDAVRAVAAQWTGPERLVVAELPVAYTRAGERLAELLAANGPTLALGVGLATGRTRLSVERLAVNLCDARIPETTATSRTPIQWCTRGRPRSGRACR